MKAQPLTRPCSITPEAWVCGVCGRCYAGQARDCAESCCRCSECQEQTGKGDYTSMHKECSDRRWQRIQRDRLEHAEKLPSWDGWVHCELIPENEGYCASLDALVEALYERVAEGELAPEDWPAYVHIAEAEAVTGLTVDEVLERVCEDGFDGIEDHIEGQEELAFALQRFTEANKNVLTYQANPKLAVAVPPYDAAVLAAPEASA